MMMAIKGRDMEPKMINNSCVDENTFSSSSLLVLMAEYAEELSR